MTSVLTALYALMLLFAPLLHFAGLRYAYVYAIKPFAEVACVTCPYGRCGCLVTCVGEGIP